MLPISVAFVVGGYSGSLLGHEDFFWSGAIGWGTIIGIIDYNFSIMEELSKIGWMGRVVLIMTSAIITASVGDHLILKETIKSEKIKYFDKQISVLKSTKPEHVMRSGIESDVSRLKANVDTTLGKIEETNGLILQRCGAERPGPSCRNLQEKVMPSLKGTLEIQQKAYDLARKELDEAETAGFTKRDKDVNVLEGNKEKVDIVLEMKLLYKAIFAEWATIIVFILFALMVICIETLPLLLKSGVTIEEAKARRLAKEEAIKAAEQKVKDEADKLKKERDDANRKAIFGFEQKILRSNR